MRALHLSAQQQSLVEYQDTRTAVLAEVDTAIKPTNNTPRSHHANRNRRVVNQKSIIYEFHGPSLDRQFVAFTNVVAIRHFSPSFPRYRKDHPLHGSEV
jgi:hypothetical protein